MLHNDLTIKVTNENNGNHRQSLRLFFPKTRIGNYAQKCGNWIKIYLIIKCKVTDIQNSAVRKERHVGLIFQNHNDSAQAIY